MQVEPYLMFNGRCQEAIDFYRSALGAEIEMLLRFSESPDKPPAGTMPEHWGDKIMHCTLRIGATRVMVSDGCDTNASDFKGVSLTASAADEAEADRVFTALSAGGRVTMPLGKTFFSPRFGMLVDRFGLGWMVIVAQENAALAA
jgi:PhnB protein